MRFNISQDLLAQTLSAVGKAVSSRAINPVLTYVRIVAEPDSLTFTATDGDFTIRRQIAVPQAEPGRILAPARLLSDLVARLPKKEIELRLEGNQLHVAAGRSNYDLTVLSDENFPDLPDFSGHLMTTLPCGILKRALTQTTFASVKESGTGGIHYTNGVFFNFRGGRLDIVATDGHRLALKRNEGIAGNGPDSALLLPARVADELEKMLPDDDEAAVELFHHNNQVFFRFGTQLVASALLDVKFPDYERVIPKDIESKVHAGREELGECLSRVLLMTRSKDQNPVARMSSAEGTLTLSSDGGELGKGQEELAAEISGGDVKVAINPQYIIDALKALGGEQVTLNWISEVNPVMLTSAREPDFTYIVMPIRLD